MNAELRESLERDRRAKLHRQIGALEAALVELEGGPREVYFRRAWKLKNKIRRLYQELNQPMLLTL